MLHLYPARDFWCPAQTLGYAEEADAGIAAAVKVRSTGPAAGAPPAAAAPWQPVPPQAQTRAGAGAAGTPTLRRPAAPGRARCRRPWQHICWHPHAAAPRPTPPTLACCAAGRPPQRPAAVCHGPLHLRIPVPGALRRRRPGLGPAHRCHAQRLHPAAAARRARPADACGCPEERLRQRQLHGCGRALAELAGAARSAPRGAASPAPGDGGGCPGLLRPDQGAVLGQRAQRRAALPAHRAPAAARHPAPRAVALGWQGLTAAPAASWQSCNHGTLQLGGGGGHMLLGQQQGMPCHGPRPVKGRRGKHSTAVGCCRCCLWIAVLGCTPAAQAARHGNADRAFPHTFGVPLLPGPAHEGCSSISTSDLGARRCRGASA